MTYVGIESKGAKDQLFYLKLKIFQFITVEIHIDFCTWLSNMLYCIQYTNVVYDSFNALHKDFKISLALIGF